MTAPISHPEILGRAQRMPDYLTWFKWESYATRLIGAALLMIVYWVGGELFLIDAEKADLALWQGILISAASLTVGWLIFDFLCKAGMGERPTLLMVLLFVLLVRWAGALTRTSPAVR